jgi:hypothetical protein
MRLSTLAAQVIKNYLATNDPSVLSEFSGTLFRARFTSRLWMRSIVASLNQSALELGCFAISLPILKKFASHVFFGRGSFPDVEARVSKYQTVEAARVSVASHVL